MSNISAMIQAVDFIESNLKEEIGVADVADAVSYSLYHFCRMFNQVIHHTPYDYLMRRRLSESARELVETDKKIIDIAFDHRFNAPETYSRAFKRMFGLQPHRWRKRGMLDRRALMCRLAPEHIVHINKGDYLKPTLVEKGTFRLAGVMTLVTDDQAIIPRIWDTLPEELKRIRGADGTGRYYGIAWYPRDWQERGYLYMAAIETEPLDTAGSPLVAKTLRPSKWVRFVHKGPYRDLNLTQDYIYQTWLPKSGEQLARSLEVEGHGPNPGGASGEESETEIYVPIR